MVGVTDIVAATRNLTETICSAESSTSKEKDDLQRRPLNVGLREVAAHLARHADRSVVSSHDFDGPPAPPMKLKVESHMCPSRFFTSIHMIPIELALHIVHLQWISVRTNARANLKHRKT